MNVHLFDNTLTNNDIKTEVTNDIKLKEFNELYNKFKTNDGKRGLRLIINDIQKPANYDTTNQMYADDVLIEIYKLLDKTDVIEYLEEQISDMYTSGQCPQGRVIRLYQIYSSLK
jgi:hypothetical protein